MKSEDRVRVRIIKLSLMDTVNNSEFAKNIMVTAGDKIEVVLTQSNKVSCVSKIIVEENYLVETL